MSKGLVNQPMHQSWSWSWSRRGGAGGEYTMMVAMMGEWDSGMMVGGWW